MITARFLVNNPHLDLEKYDALSVGHTVGEIFFLFKVKCDINMYSAVYNYSSIKWITNLVNDLFVTFLIIMNFNLTVV